MSDKPRTKKFKGKAPAADVRRQMDNNSPESPFLYIKEGGGLTISKSNLLNDPEALLYDGYERFDMDKPQFSGRLTGGTSVIVTLRYFEYLCSARFNLDYVGGMLAAGLALTDVFSMIKHHLKIVMTLNVPTVDTIYDLDLIYTGHIRYESQDRPAD